MKLKNLLIFTLALGISFAAEAQMKIGYTNLELILAYLPEAKQVSQKLQTYQQQLSKNLEAKKNYFDVKYQEYTEKAQQPGASAETMAPLEQELQKLQTELQQSLEKSDSDLAQKQNDMMTPIMEKLKKELKALAEEIGYTYILNSASSGSSIILHASETNDVSEVLLNRMGVEIPKD